MARDLTVGSKTYSYPEPGDKQGWSEDSTEWAQGVTDALTQVQGPNDILPRSAALANNVSSATAISGLLFDTGSVKHVNVEFIIERSYDSGASTVVESGQIIGNFNGSDFVISVKSVGDDTGIDINVNSSGQFTYTSTNLTGHVSSTIKFKAKTLDN